MTPVNEPGPCELSHGPGVVVKDSFRTDFGEPLRSGVQCGR